ncbi:creatininase family protein [Haloferax chudinovii]|uniref:Creatininase family protein n=1 Tax=Haloferax chudinovii TaxID=1109010 RepID=A0ABD5XJA0_9EURY
MRLSEATWTEVAALDADLALLPVGSTEQHGPHAPLGTDALNAESVAEAGAEAFDGEVVVGPTIPVGVAEEHRAFDGTLWVSPDTFRAYVRETVESLAHHGFDRVVVVNGHGGNIDALAELCRRVSRTSDVYAVAFTWFDAVGDHSSDMGHGGPLETALLRHTHPELVREDRIDEARAGGADRWGEWVSGVNLAHDSDEFTDNGVVGDPADGDAQRGAELESLAADSLASLLDAVERRQLD